MTGVFHIVLAMKPLEGNFAGNALKHGVAGINIDGCRVEGVKGAGTWGTSNATINTDRKFNSSPNMAGYRSEQHSGGRFPANIIHDGSKEVMGTFPETAPSNARARGLQYSGRHGGLAELGGNAKEGTNTTRGHNDAGDSAGRFFKQISEFQEGA